MMLRRGGCIYSEEQDRLLQERFLREAPVRREDRLRRLNEVSVRGAG